MPIRLLMLSGLLSRHGPYAVVVTRSLAIHAEVRRVEAVPASMATQTVAMTAEQR